MKRLVAFLLIMAATSAYAAGFYFEQVGLSTDTTVNFPWLGARKTTIYVTDVSDDGSEHVVTMTAYFTTGDTLLIPVTVTRRGGTGIVEIMGARVDSVAVDNTANTIVAVSAVRSADVPSYTSFYYQEIPVGTDSMVTFPWIGARRTAISIQDVSINNTGEKESYATVYFSGSADDTLRLSLSTSDIMGEEPPIIIDSDHVDSVHVVTHADVVCRVAVHR